MGRGENEQDKLKIRVNPVEPGQLESFLPLVEDYQRARSVTGIRRGRNRGFYGRILAPSQLGAMLGAHFDGEPAGFACLQWMLDALRAREVVRLGDLFVAEDFRRLGVARSLLSTTTALAQARGAAAMICRVDPENLAARGLLESVGAEAVAAVGYELTL